MRLNTKGDTHPPLVALADQNAEVVDFQRPATPRNLVNTPEVGETVTIGRLYQKRGTYVELEAEVLYHRVNEWSGNQEFALANIRRVVPE